MLIFFIRKQIKNIQAITDGQCVFGLAPVKMFSFANQPLLILSASKWPEWVTTCVSASEILI